MMHFAVIIPIVINLVLRPILQESQETYVTTSIVCNIEFTQIVAD